MVRAGVETRHVVIAALKSLGHQEWLWQEPCICNETHSENLKERRVYLGSQFGRMQSVMEEKV